jgi:hypothetical protein
MNYLNLLVYSSIVVGGIIVWYLIVYYVIDIIEWWLSR